MSETLEIDELLIRHGFDTPEALEVARRVLIEAGLTREGKTGIAASKLEAIQAALAAVDLVCPDPTCQRLAKQQSGLPQAIVSPASCSICGGSGSAKAFASMVSALQGTGISKLLILGGTPSQHREMAGLAEGSGLEIRCIDGSEGAHTKAMASTNLDWADLAVIWASTPLSHKVSQGYTNSADQRRRCPQITVPRRSIGALCNAVVEHLSRK